MSLCWDRVAPRIHRSPTWARFLRHCIHVGAVASSSPRDTHAKIASPTVLGPPHTGYRIRYTRRHEQSRKRSKAGTTKQLATKRQSTGIRHTDLPADIRPRTSTQRPLPRSCSESAVDIRVGRKAYGLFAMTMQHAHATRTHAPSHLTTRQECASGVVGANLMAGNSHPRTGQADRPGAPMQRRWC